MLLISNKIIGEIHMPQQLQGNMKFGNYQPNNDYNEAKNKPSINDVELKDNKTAKDLKLQDEMEEISNIELDEIFKF